PQYKDAAVADSVVSGNDDEPGTAHSPPGLGDFAVGDPAVIQNVLLANALRPLALKVKRTVGRQHARPRDDLGMSLAADVVKLALLVLGVVLQVVGPDLLVFIEIPEVDVSAGMHVAGAFVPIDLVGPKQHLGVFQLDWLA